MMSTPITSEQPLFDQFVDDENYEESSDGANTSYSDIEPEVQLSESDEFDVLEYDGNADSESHIISGRTWMYTAPSSNNIEIQNSSYKCSLTRKSEHIETMDECFHLFINEQIIDTIILHTNNKANESMPSNKKWKPIDRIELDAFFGLLLLTGRFRESRERIHDLWKQNEALSRPVYAATMSRDRFADILKYIRFDDSATREKRKSTDKLAPLRDITNIFTENCKDSYNATNVGCIDKQLVTFRGRCPFKVYMPSNHGKYGIKIWTLCDAKTFYCCNMDIYLGKLENTSAKQHEQHVIKQLIGFWKNSGRTITTNNFFTDLSLAEELLDNNIFIVGTVRKNKRDLPKILTQTQNRSQYSSEFLFTDKLTLVSYIPKPQKCIILLSTLHHGHNISAAEKNYKPDIINYYNSTKNSIDVFDKIVREYCCRRCTCRWPLSLFMYYIDIAAYNAFVTWLTKYPTWEGKNSLKTKRKIFLEELSKRLITKNIDRRATQFENHEVTFHKSVVNAIEATGRRVVKNIPRVVSQKRSRCYICVGNDNKYRSTCNNCSKHICNIHAIQDRTVLCNRCCIELSGKFVPVSYFS